MVGFLSFLCRETATQVACPYPIINSDKDMNKGMLRMATGVPNPVDVPTKADEFASGSAVRIVGGPEMSELEAAMTASRMTPPSENPVS